MLTTVICTACGNPISILGSSIELPYICPPCEQAYEATDTADTVVTDPPFDTDADEECDCELCRHETAEETAEPEPFETEPEPTEAIECDTASVENTTLLIADLEEQLAASETEALALAEELVGTLTTDTFLMNAASQRIDQLEKSEQWLIETAANAAIEIGQLEAELDEAHTFEAMSHVALAKAVNTIDELKASHVRLVKSSIESEINAARAINDLNYQVADLQNAYTDAEASTSYYKDWGTEQRDRRWEKEREFDELYVETYSFWSRLKHLFSGY